MIFFLLWRHTWQLSVVRTLLQVLGGTLLESERARHRGSQSPGKYYKKGVWTSREGEFRKFRRERVSRRFLHVLEELAVKLGQGYSRPKISGHGIQR